MTEFEPPEPPHPGNTRQARQSAREREMPHARILPALARSESVAMARRFFTRLLAGCCSAFGSSLPL